MGLKIKLNKFNEFNKKVEGLSNNLPNAALSIPNWAAAAVALACMPNSMRQAYKIAIKKQTELEREKKRGPGLWDDPGRI